MIERKLLVLGIILMTSWIVSTLDKEKKAKSRRVMKKIGDYFYDDYGNFASTREERLRYSLFHSPFYAQPIRRRFSLIPGSPPQAPVYFGHPLDLRDIGFQIPRHAEPWRQKQLQQLHREQLRLITPPPFDMNKDCDAIWNATAVSGAFMVPINGAMFQAYCQIVGNRSNWMVIQSRSNGQEDFYRTWTDYESGFGDRDMEHWIGLEAMYEATKLIPSYLRVDLTDFNGNMAYAEYSSFRVLGPSNSYRLQISGYNSSSTAGDALSYHNGFPFTTRDRDNDFHYMDRNCARENRGGWWYGSCYHANLNGQYMMQGSTSSRGIIWYPWRQKLSLRNVTMRIRPNYQT